MIELKDVYKSYGSSFSGLGVSSLNIPSGEIIGVLGVNGSGKTTFLKMLMGLGDLDQGEISFDGLPIQKQYQNASYMTEEGSFFPANTPLQYGDFLNDFFPDFDQQRYLMLLDFFSLPQHGKIRTFSKGQKSKLEIAAGFSKGASYIFMDEPFMGNDLQTRRDFLKLMVSSLNNEETILIATHFIDEIEQALDRALILRYGRIREDFYLDEMRAKGWTLEAVMDKVAGYRPGDGQHIFL